MNVNQNNNKVSVKRIEYIHKVAESYREAIKESPIFIPDSGVIAGPRRFYKDNPMEIWKRLEDEELFLGIDNCHFPMNSSFLQLGYRGIIEKASSQRDDLSLEQKEFLEAIRKVYEAAEKYIFRHALEAQCKYNEAGFNEMQRFSVIANNCRVLSEGKPQNFMQAVQLFWFSWRLRGIFTSSIGRLDQYLYHFYKNDIEQGSLTKEEALDVLIELWEAFNDAGTGDTLKNLMLGGVDSEGEDSTNELSYLMLEASIVVRKPEPHINVRIHSSTPKEFIQKVVELQLIGQGQPTIYNDDLLIASLTQYGVPLESARNYSNDGCTELVIDGESGIVFLQMEAVKSLELTLFNGEENKTLPKAMTKKWTNSMPEFKPKTNLKLGYKSGDLTKMGSFEEVYEAFIKQYLYQTDRMLQVLCSDMHWLKDEGVSSPFLSGTFPICLEKAVDPFRGGFNVECYQLLSGSITTAADSLAAIKKVVFEDGYCNIGELLEAVQSNFDGCEELRQRLINAPKFGNDDDFVDCIAADIAKRFCEYVLNYPTPNGKPVWPGLYNIDFNTFTKILGATPDGRKAGDPIAEHFSPTPGRAKNGPTAVINSAVKAPLSLGVASSPLHITLSRDNVPMNETGKSLLEHLLISSLKMGVVVLNTAIYDEEVLKKAKANPEYYGDIVVRVWGFNARFVDLTEDLQDHIIERILS